MGIRTRTHANTLDTFTKFFVDFLLSHSFRKQCQAVAHAAPLYHQFADEHVQCVRAHTLASGLNKSVAFYIFAKFTSSDEKVIIVRND